MFGSRKKRQPDSKQNTAIKTSGDFIKKSVQSIAETHKNTAGIISLSGIVIMNNVFVSIGNKEMLIAVRWCGMLSLHKINQRSGWNLFLIHRI